MHLNRYVTYILKQSIKYIITYRIYSYKVSIGNIIVPCEKIDSLIRKDYRPHFVKNA